MKPLISFIGTLSSLTTLAVLIALCMSKVVMLKNVLKWVAIYSGISFVNDLLLAFVPSVFHYHFLFSFTLLEYGCFAWMFYMMLGKPLFKKLVVVGSFAFLVIVCITLRSYGSMHFDNVNTGTEAILIIVYSILYFSEKLSVENMEPIFDSPGSYIVMACLFYLAGNLFLFITSEDQTTSIWIINSLFNLTRNIFFFVAIRQCTKMKKPPMSAIRMPDLV